MHIVVNKTVVALAIFLAIGYVIIVVTVLFDDNSNSAGINVDNSLGNSLSNSNVDTELRIKNAQLLALDQQIEELQQQLAKANANANSNSNSNYTEGYHPGVIVLGMHRSGTSVLGGLLNKMGLATGGPLISPGKDNEKGFFERIDVVLQNDYLMKRQKIHYAFSTYKYNPLIGLKDILTNYDYDYDTYSNINSNTFYNSNPLLKTNSNYYNQNKFFKEGSRGLLFLNNKNNYPWMLKDPRLCITLRTWLPLLSFTPAIIFTYRHPYDVALSLNKREQEHFRIGKGLRMWYTYNKLAILQSNDLCRVITSHRKVMSTPTEEFDRIYNDLHSCGVPVPRKLLLNDIQSFIDLKLQHGRSSLIDDSCHQSIETLVPPSSWVPENKEQLGLYRETMRVYCAMEDGTAFSPHFIWADFKDINDA